MEKKSFHHGGTIFPPGWNNIFSMEERFTIRHLSFPLTIGRLNEKYGVCKEKVKTEVNKRGFFSF